MRSSSSGVGVRGSTGWLIVEMKMSYTGPVEKAARSALGDLLAYRQAFESTLSTSAVPYGLGIAWGRGVHPAAEQVVLCSPDSIGDALSICGFA